MKPATQRNTSAVLRDRGICVIIPTYNNDTTVEDVIKQCADYCLDIIVVNDGSTDNTKTIIEGIPNITIVSYPKNRGKGYALKQGIKKALALGFSYAITIDADGQHYANDIPTFLEANISNPGSLIIGTRNMKG